MRSPDRAESPGGGFRPPGRGGARGRGRRRRLAAPRRDGRALRTEPHLRAGAREGDQARGEQAARRAPDDRPGRSVPGCLRRSGGRCHHRPPRGLAASASHAPGDPVPGLQGRGGAQPRDADLDGQVGARQHRPAAGDDGQSGLRRPGLHREPARQDRRAQAADRRFRLPDPPPGRWRRHARDRAARAGGRRRSARRRDGGVRCGRLPGGDRGAAGTAGRGRVLAGSGR